MDQEITLVDPLTVDGSGCEGKHGRREGREADRSAILLLSECVREKRDAPSFPGFVRGTKRERERDPFPPLLLPFPDTIAPQIASRWPHSLGLVYPPPPLCGGLQLTTQEAEEEEEEAASSIRMGGGLSSPPSLFCASVRPSFEFPPATLFLYLPTYLLQLPCLEKKRNDKTRTVGTRRGGADGTSN